MNDQFAHFIETDEITFKYAKGICDIAGREFHAFHEILLFLGGTAEFISEKCKIHLIPGTVVVIPRESFHQIIIRGKESDYHRCVFRFGCVNGLDVLISRKITQPYALRASDDILRQFDELRHTAVYDGASEEASVLSKALLARILCVITPPMGDTHGTTLHPLVSDALAYINDNITSDLSVSDIADSLHISNSHLMRIFKNDLHIPIYRYITEKRMILAAGDIEKGLLPTLAAEKYGFGDYSGFYKRYKKMFGSSPSQSYPGKLWSYVDSGNAQLKREGQ